MDGTGPIPFTALFSWLRFVQIPQFLWDEYINAIQALDHVYLDYIQKKQKQLTKKGKAIGKT